MSTYLFAEHFLRLASTEHLSVMQLARSTCPAMTTEKMSDQLFEHSRLNVYRSVKGFNYTGNKFDAFHRQFLKQLEMRANNPGSHEARVMHWTCNRMLLLQETKGCRSMLNRVESSFFRKKVLAQVPVPKFEDDFIGN